MVHITKEKHSLKFRLLSSGWRNFVVLLVYTNILEGHAACIVSTETFLQNVGNHQKDYMALQATKP
jgi:hypothetical protein